MGLELKVLYVVTEFLNILFFLCAFVKGHLSVIHRYIINIRTLKSY